MAIKDTSRKPYIEDNDTRVKIGIDLPIRRGDSFEGYFASSSTTIEAVKNNIRNLLNTHRGERVFQPNLGLNLRRLLFEHITSDNLLGVQNAILDQLELWLPFVEVRDIKIFRKEDDIVVGSNEIRVKVIFNIKQDPNTLDSVTMDFSGQINESESLTTGGTY